MKMKKKKRNRKGKERKRENGPAQHTPPGCAAQCNHQPGWCIGVPGKPAGTERAGWRMYGTTISRTFFCWRGGCPEVERLHVKRNRLVRMIFLVILDELQGYKRFINSLPCTE
jgi:hypothetical protein